MSPSMPLRSTNAPKSTMFEIWPSTMSPGCRRSRISWRCSLRSSSRTARRERTTLLRERLSSMTLHSIFVPMYSSRLGTRRMSTSEAGRKPRTPRSMIRPPLTTSMTVPSTGSPDSAARLDAPPCLLEARALLGHDQAAVLVLLGEDEGIHLLAQLDLVVRVDGLADGQLVRGDDPLALVADVDQDLVVVDAHDAACDDLALLEGGEGGVVVRDDLPVDLEQQAIGAFDDARVGRRGHGLGHGRPRVAQPRPAYPPCPMPARATKRGAERTPLGGEYDVLVCGASFAGLTVARELAGAGARVLIARPLRDRGAPDLRLRGAHRVARAPRAQGSPIRQTFGELVVHTPGAHAALEAAVDVLHVRLPASCARRCTDSATREFETATIDGPTTRTGHTVHTDRGDLSAPLIVDALGLAPGARRRPADPAAERAALARPGGASPGRRRGPGAVARPRLRARGVLVELPGSRRAARRRRLLRPARPRQGADGAPGRRPRPAAAGLPGQLDPAPDARAGRGRDPLRGRQRRPLPAHDGRGHPARLLLRAGRRPRAARGGRGPRRRASRRSPATRPSARSAAGRSTGCCGSSISSAA